MSGVLKVDLLSRYFRVRVFVMYVLRELESLIVSRLGCEKVGESDGGDGGVFF